MSGFCQPKGSEKPAPGVLLTGPIQPLQGNEPQLESLFAVLDPDKMWSANGIDDIVGYTQNAWVKGDHGSDNRPIYTPRQIEQATPLLGELGFYTEVPPPDEAPDQVLIAAGLLGGTEKVLAWRQAHLASSLSETETVILTGRRQRSTEEGAKIAEMLQDEALLQDPWVQSQLALPETSDSGESCQFSTETELSRLAIIATGVRSGHTPDAPLLGAYTFPATSNEGQVHVLNAPAVARYGRPRPTTASCALEGLKQYPIAENGKVLLVACNPHIQRTGQGVLNAYRKAGREDIQVSVCGPGADEKANFYIALGELGRLLYDARLANTTED